MDRAFERETAEACFHYGLKMCSYGPLAGGVLSGKYSDDNADLSKARHQLFPSFQKRYHLDRTKRAAKKYAELAKENDITPSQLAIAWQRSRWYIDSIIIGATTMEQLEENIAPFTKDIQLSKDVLEKIDEIHREHKDPTNDVVRSLPRYHKKRCAGSAQRLETGRLITLFSYATAGVHVTEMSDACIHSSHLCCELLL